MRAYIRLLFLGLALSIPAAAQQQPAPSGAKRLYIEERIKSASGASTHCDSNGNCYGRNTTATRNVSLEVTREVLKRCPSEITITDNRGAADYSLRIEPGASTLYAQNGDAVYVSPTRWRATNLAKDVCNFVSKAR